MPHVAPGSLPAAGTPVLAGIELPRGRPIAPAESPEAPVAWISEEPLRGDRLTDLVRPLIGAYPATGLWPMRAEGIDGIDRPWLEGEFGGPDPRTLTAREVLDGSFRAALYGDLDDVDDEFPPEFTFTEFAAPVGGRDLAPTDITFDSPGALLLVPVARPADVPKVLGWWGPTNYDLVGEPVSAVLRSWEERFGAVPIDIGFDTLTLYVPRHPRRKRLSRNGDDQVRLLAAEHYAFCPDNIDQGLDAEDYVTGLSDWDHWAFWWD